MQEYKKWFPHAKYGMFIHWGLYSLCGRGEWVMYTNAIPRNQYNGLAHEFNPQNFTPATWAAQAKRAGMRYMVMTAKHHDGFCLFDSKYTDFTSVKTAAKRDFVAEYVVACRNEGLKVGIYFSAKDWQWKEYFNGPAKDPEGWKRFIEFYSNQVKELCMNYGKIDILWFDGGDAPHFEQQPADALQQWNAAELEAWIRKAQPGILINARSGMCADFHNLEKQAYSTMNPGDTLFESCDSLSEEWCYCPGDYTSSTRTVFHYIASSASNGSNLLLNVTPDGNGVIPEPQREVLNCLGEWLERNGEAFYGTERLLPAWWEMIDCGILSTKGNAAYLILRHYPPDRSVTFWKLGNKVLQASLLSTGEPLLVSNDHGRTVISGLPKNSPDDIASVIKLELDGPAHTGNPELFF